MLSDMLGVLQYIAANWLFNKEIERSIEIDYL